MSRRVLPTIVWSGLVLAAGAPSAVAQSTMDLPDIVVTANRQPERIERQGSAISVVGAEQIQTSNSNSVVDALRSVPGLDVSETGGPGATTSVRLRGASNGQTLVLIDGIKVNDSVPASGDFDFSTLLPSAIDRIEVLRGPQSALYGSDAIGGVINIITKKGGGEPRQEVRVEGGSYGTINGSATSTGSSGPWSWALSGGGQKSAGFSRYGYRVGQLERRFGAAFEPDGFARWGGLGKIGYDAGEGARIEIGVMSFKTISELDAASSTLPRLVQATGARRIYPDTPGEVERRLSQVFARGTLEQGPLTHTLTLYANQTDRTFRETTYRAGAVPIPTRVDTDFFSDRVGAEYQGNLKLDAFGSLTFGGKYEWEKGKSYSTNVIPVATPRVGTLDAEQTTRSLFALYQLPLGERIILTAGGRHDRVDDREFNTFRATGAYLIPETGTKLRASGGTGGKAPTLYQLFSPQYGNANLNPETSIGWDAGIDQTLFDGRATLSATAFGNKFSDLIEFDSVTQRYRNVSRAKTSGTELESTFTVLPDWVKVRAAYTYLHAQDERTGLTLQRRPDHVGRLSVAITPMENLLIEPRVTLVSRRFSDSSEAQRLPRYARLDVYAEYKIDQNWRVFGRVENVTNTRYQEILNYGTTGRAFYGGASMTW